MSAPRPYWHDDKLGLAIYCGDSRDIVGQIEPEAAEPGQQIGLFA